MSSSSGGFPRVAAHIVALAFSAAAVVVAAPGCSSDPKPAACDSSKCAAGNKCLALNGETKCRKTCASNADPATSCPTGYTCVAHPESEPFCEQQVNAPAPGPKQWGTPCNPAFGLENNKDCDVDNGFFCFGQSPDDASAYCTRYECTKDLDCAPGFFCGDVNVAPNVKTAKRTFHETVKVCQRRAYCAPCVADFDCPTIAGSPQRCITDDDGNGFCTNECDQSRACNVDAKCVDLGGVKLCYPRAGRCKGQGELCSPCRSDADCPQGTCVTGSYTTEKFCTVKSPSPCTNDENNGKACPAPIGPPKRAVRCLGNQDDGRGGVIFPDIPKDECHGMYPLGESGDVGCWTPDR